MGIIYHRDALDGLLELETESIDIVIADAPYNIGKNFGSYKDNLDLNKYVRWSHEWINLCFDALKPSGTMYVYGFIEILAHIATSFIGLDFKFLIWHYTNKTVPKHKFWQRSHEAILCLWKEEHCRIFNVDDVRESYTKSFVKNAAGKTRKATKGRYSHSDKETIYKEHPLGALPRDVIKVPALAGGAGMIERWFLCKSCNDVFCNKFKQEHEDHQTIHHPTQKPYKLTERLLLAAKPKENGKVLIPFVGSGSECAVAEDLGMDYIGFEINKDYIELAEKFLRKRNV